MSLEETALKHEMFAEMPAEMQTQDHYENVLLQGMVYKLKHPVMWAEAYAAYWAETSSPLPLIIYDF